MDSSVSTSGAAQQHSSKDEGNADSNELPELMIPGFRRTESLVGRDEGFDLFSNVSVPSLASPKEIQYDYSRSIDGDGKDGDLSKVHVGPGSEAFPPIPSPPPNPSPRSISSEAAGRAHQTAGMPSLDRSASPSPSSASRTDLASPVPISDHVKHIFQRHLSVSPGADQTQTISSNTSSSSGTSNGASSGAPGTSDRNGLQWEVVLQPYKPPPATTATTTAAAGGGAAAAGITVAASVASTASAAALLSKLAAATSGAEKKKQMMIKQQQNKKKKKRKHSDESDEEESGASDSDDEDDSSSSSGGDNEEEEEEEEDEDDDNASEMSESRATVASHGSHDSGGSFFPARRKVQVYSAEERRIKVKRFKDKKRRWKKGGRRVIYEVRKTFADSRPRVGGRFIKKTPEEKKAREEAKQRLREEKARERAERKAAKQSAKREARQRKETRPTKRAKTADDDGDVPMMATLGAAATSSSLARGAAAPLWPPL